MARLLILQELVRRKQLNRRLVHRDSLRSDIGLDERSFDLALERLIAENMVGETPGKCIVTLSPWGEEVATAARS